MRVFWWQGGLHFEPENDDDRKALTTLADVMKLSTLGGPPQTGSEETGK